MCSFIQTNFWELLNPRGYQFPSWWLIVKSVRAFLKLVPRKSSVQFFPSNYTKQNNSPHLNPQLLQYRNSRIFYSPFFENWMLVDFKSLRHKLLCKYSHTYQDILSHPSPTLYNSTQNFDLYLLLSRTSRFPTLWPSHPSILKRKEKKVKLMFCS